MYWSQISFYISIVEPFGITIHPHQLDEQEHMPLRSWSEPFSVLEIRLMPQVWGFGFRIIGGKEEGSQVSTWEDMIHMYFHNLLT